MTDLTPARSELILGGQKSGKSRRAELLARHWLAQSASHRALLIATAQAWDDEMRQRIARHQADRLLRVPGMATLEEPLHLAEAIWAHSQPDTLIVVDCLTLWLTNRLMPAEAAIQTHAPQHPPPPQPSPSGGGSNSLSMSLEGVVQTNALEHPRPPQPSPSGGGRLSNAQPASQWHLAVAPSPAGGRLGWGLAVGAQPAAETCLSDNTTPVRPLLAPATEYMKNQPLALMEQALAAPLLEAIKQARGPLVLVGNEIGLGVIPLGREVRAFVDALGLLNQSVAGVCQRVTLMAAGLPLTLKDAP